MATGIGSLSVQITGSATGLSASLKDAESQLKGFQKNAKAAAGGGTAKNEFAGFNLKIGETLKSEIGVGQIAMGNLISSAVEFGAALAKASAHGLANLVRDSVKIAADMESTRIDFEVMTGDKGTSDALFGKLRDLAARSPLTQKDVAEAGKALLASGEKSSNVTPMIEMLGNYASKEFGVKDVAMKLAQVKGKGQLYSEELKEFAEHGIQIAPLLSKMLKKSDAEVRALVADGKVTAPMLVRAMHEGTMQGGLYAGRMEKQGASFNGLTSTLTDSFETAAGNFGDIIIRELDLKGLVKEITSMFSGDDSKEFAKDLADFVREFKPFIAEGVAMAKALIEGGKWLVKFITPAVKFVADLMIAVDKFGAVVNRWFGGGQAGKSVKDEFGYDDNDITGRGDFSHKKSMGGFIDDGGLDYGQEQLSAKQLEHAKSISQQYDPMAFMREQAEELQKMRDLGAFKDRPDQFAFAMGKIFEPTMKAFDDMQNKMGANASKGSVEAASIISASMQRDGRGNLQERAVAAAEHAKWVQEQNREYLRQIADALSGQNMLGVK